MSGIWTFVLIAGGITLVVTLAAEATGTLSFIWNPEAMIIVVVGSFLAASAGSSPAAVKAAISSLRQLSSKPEDIPRIIEWWLLFNKRWRADGISGLADIIARAPNPTSAAIAQLCADGFDAETIERLAHQMVETRYQQAEHAIAFYRRLAGFAPTMGIIGTVIGLASALANGGDHPIALLQRIGFAFSATLWGLVTANFVWLPIAHRLRTTLEYEQAINRIHLDAIAYVASGTTPILTRYMLAMRVPEPYRSTLLQQDREIRS